MSDAINSQGKDRLRYWMIKVAAVAVLVLIGYKIPTIWPPLCVAVWGVYALSLITSSFLLRKPEGSEAEKRHKIKKIVSFVGNIATAALISAPVVVGHWYRVMYFGNR